MSSIRPFIRPLAAATNDTRWFTFTAHNTFPPVSPRNIVLNQTTACYLIKLRIRLTGDSHHKRFTKILLPYVTHISTCHAPDCRQHPRPALSSYQSAHLLNPLQPPQWVPYFQPSPRLALPDLSPPGPLAPPAPCLAQRRHQFALLPDLSKAICKRPAVFYCSYDIHTVVLRSRLVLCTVYNRLNLWLYVLLISDSLLTHTV